MIQSNYTKIASMIFAIAISVASVAQNQVAISKQVIAILKDRVMKAADSSILLIPITVTANKTDRSAGGIHDFYSDGDYWWPNPADVNGPYIQKDGQSNPNNFNAHRLAMIRFSQIVGNLASAYAITHEERYVKAAMVHLKAWFINDSTYMNPSLLYAQAIKGKVTGRSTGLIDMIQLTEVAQGIRIMENAKSVNQEELKKIKYWFTQYLNWVTTHPYGVEEREAKNNHGTCWILQVAIFAKLTGDQALLDYCSNRVKTVIYPNQLAQDGSLPLELKRTKPYGYSLFDLDALTAVAKILSTKSDNLFTYTLPDGRNLIKTVEYLVPFVMDKSTWTFPKDVMYWDEWPVAQPFLFFASQQYKDKKYFTTWERLEHFPTNGEVLRNLPIRNPILWLNK